MYGYLKLNFRKAQKPISSLNVTKPKNLLEANVWTNENKVLRLESKALCHKSTPVQQTNII